MLLKIIYFIYLFTCVISCNQVDKTSNYVFPTITKGEKKVIKNTHYFVYGNKNISLEEIKKLEKIRKNNYILSSYFFSSYLKNIRYISSKKYILYSSYENGKSQFYTKDIQTKKKDLLKTFSNKIYYFYLDSNEKKIAIYFSNNKIKLYTFPNFKLLKEIKGREAKFDIKIDRLYFIRGGSLYYIGKNNTEKIIYKKKDYYSSVSIYSILNNSDILITSPDKVSFMELLFKGKKHKAKTFLLSDPNTILKN